MPEGDVVEENSVVTRCRLCDADYGVSTVVKSNVWIGRNGQEHFVITALEPRVSPGFPEICPRSSDGRHEIIINH